MEGNVYETRRDKDWQWVAEIVQLLAYVGIWHASIRVRYLYVLCGWNVEF